MNDETSSQNQFQLGCRKFNGSRRRLFADPGSLLLSLYVCWGYTQTRLRFPQIRFPCFVHCHIVLSLSLYHFDYQMQEPRIHSNHNYLHACRVGEAQNPGPPGHLDVCMVNPASLAGKTEFFLSLQADVLALAETSATAFVQHEVIQSMKYTGYSLFFGQAVDDKFKSSSLRDDRPSRRGDALGTAIFARVSSRQHRIPGASVLHQSCRFTSCICYFGMIEVLVVSAYFFPGRTLEAQSKNDVLLTHIYDFVAKTQMPFLIAADFI